MALKHKYVLIFFVRGVKPSFTIQYCAGLKKWNANIIRDSMKYVTCVVKDNRGFVTGWEQRKQIVTKNKNKFVNERQTVLVKQLNCGGTYNHTLTVCPTQETRYANTA